MCIIVYSPAGVQLPDETVIKQCFKSNRDGAGYMYRYGTKIRIRKGFFKVGDLIRDLKNINSKHNLVNTDVAIHFRIATSGKVSAATCHPFPISTHIYDLKSKYHVVDAALCHNGIISDLSRDRTSALSDTMYFAKRCDLLGYREALQSLPAGSGKFVIMTGTETFLEGFFIEDKGIKYSNASYRAYTHPVYSVWSGDGYTKFWRRYTADIQSHLPKSVTKTKKQKTHNLHETGTGDEIEPLWEPRDNYGVPCDGVCEYCPDILICNYADEYERKYDKWREKNRIKEYLYGYY